VSLLAALRAIASDRFDLRADSRSTPTKTRFPATRHGHAVSANSMMPTSGGWLDSKQMVDQHAQAAMCCSRVAVERPLVLGPMSCPHAQPPSSRFANKEPGARPLACLVLPCRWRPAGSARCGRAPCGRRRGMAGSWPLIGTNAVGVRMRSWLSIASPFPARGPDAAHRYYITSFAQYLQRSPPTHRSRVDIESSGSHSCCSWPTRTKSPSGRAEATYSRNLIYRRAGVTVKVLKGDIVLLVVDEVTDLPG